MKINGTDKLYIEFIDSLDMSIPRNDCTEYRDQSDYKAIDFMRLKLEAVTKAAQAFQNLSTCYRLGKQPSDKLFKELSKARIVLDVR